MPASKSLSMVSFAASVFRACRPGETDLGTAAAMSKKSPGRFNTSKLGALYVAVEPETALREFRESGDASGGCTIIEVDARLQRVVDLCDPLVRHQVRVTEDDITADDVSRCQELAE